VAAGGLVAPCIETVSPAKRERLFDCEAFRLCRLIGQAPFTVGATAEPRVLICIHGSGQIESDRISYTVGKGDTWLLPADSGVCGFRPSGEVTLLEIAIQGL
jgi:mannose-6-phosphate isomerase